MVRTAAGVIRISSGKSSKKGFRGSSGANGSTSAKSSSSSKGSSRLPPIPHTETPSWQKPITNFFEASSSKDNQGTKNEIQKVGETIIDNSNKIISNISKENDKNLKEIQGSENDRVNDLENKKLSEKKSEDECLPQPKIKRTKRVEKENKC